MQNACGLLGENMAFIPQDDEDSQEQGMNVLGGPTAPPAEQAPQGGIPPAGQAPAGGGAGSGGTVSARGIGGGSFDASSHWKGNPREPN